MIDERDFFYRMKINLVSQRSDLKSRWSNCSKDFIRGVIEGLTMAVSDMYDLATKSRQLSVTQDVMDIIHEIEKEKEENEN